MLAKSVVFFILSAIYTECFDIYNTWPFKVLAQASSVRQEYQKCMQNKIAKSPPLSRRTSASKPSVEPKSLKSLAEYLKANNVEKRISDMFSNCEGLVKWSVEMKLTSKSDIDLPPSCPMQVHCIKELLTTHTAWLKQKVPVAETRSRRFRQPHHKRAKLHF